jgi:hypothetical protein
MTYNIWNKWDKLKTVMLGDCYSAEFFRDIKNDRIRSSLQQIADETQEDLNYFEKVLKDFGCTVLRPVLDKNDSIFNYINIDGQVAGAQQGVPRSPLQPRDTQLVIGNKLYYTGIDHHSIAGCLNSYNIKDSDNSLLPSNMLADISDPVTLTKSCFEKLKGADWLEYEDYLTPGYYEKLDPEIRKEILKCSKEKGQYVLEEILQAPSVTVVGKDIYIDWDTGILTNPELKELAHLKEYFINSATLGDIANLFRINSLSIGGHNDGCFHTIKEGAILSLLEIQTYKNTFPNWEVCYLPNQSWDKIDGFLKLKEQVKGKWWVPGQEDNAEFTNFVETWLQDWVGYVEETVFDVNVLVLDEHHICVSNMDPTVIEFLKKHKMEPVHIPWRHRYFWDGGLHCITLDLEREGVQQDYFPNRTGPVVDKGFV